MPDDTHPDSGRSTNGSPSPMSNATELAVGESLPTRREGRLEVETTRSKEHLFTTIYSDADTGEVRLALQVDIRTGQTAIDPRRLDRTFWTLVAGNETYSATNFERLLRQFRSPGIEVMPKAQEIRLYDDEAADNQ
jgi:hypothetical protein